MICYSAKVLWDMRVRRGHKRGIGLYIVLVLGHS